MDEISKKFSSSQGSASSANAHPLAIASTNPPPIILIEPIVRRALEEDLGRAGDITTDIIIPAEQNSNVAIVAREAGIISGLIAADLAFRLLDAKTTLVSNVCDGMRVTAGQLVARVTGPTRALLSAERVALNFLGHLSGVATATNHLVERISGTKARIICTRKTTPGLRILEKYAVRCGGGLNHRFGLDDAVLVKDNHVAAAGGVAAAIQHLRGRLGPMVRIEVEVDSLEQLRDALAQKIDAILLDNMTPGTLIQAVTLAKGRATLEASGGITLDSVRNIAESGVDYISSGAITHSARCLDLGLDFL